MVTQIAAAATEQSYSTQSVTSSVAEIASIIERTATSSQQSVEACQQLALLANELTGLVVAFKVGQNPDDHNASDLPGAERREASLTVPLHGFSRPVAAMRA
jgi:hypothetical protein